jgi:hypothetical protein
VEKHSAARGIERQVAELVEDYEIEAKQALGELR